MKAIIDIGSNSCKMIIFSKMEDLIDPIKYLDITSLAKDNINLNLDKKRMNDTLFTIKDFIKKAKKYNAEIYIFATEAVRNAKNKEEFVSLVYKETGYQIDVLTGEEEAYIGYSGTKLVVKSNYTLVDIGGASTEIISDTFKKSYKIGAIKFMNENIKLEDIFVDLPKADKLVFIGGTISDVVQMRDKIEKYKRKLIHNKKVYYSEIKKINEMLKEMSISQRENVIGLLPKRKDAITYGIDIILYLLDSFEKEFLIYSDYGGMEGYALKKGLL